MSLHTIKEDLIAAENRRHTIHRDTAFMQFVQIIFPKLVLDKECHTRVCDIQELLHISRFVKRQIADNIRSPVVLAHFITGRREKVSNIL